MIEGILIVYLLVTFCLAATGAVALDRRHPEDPSLDKIIFALMFAVIWPVFIILAPIKALVSIDRKVRGEKK